MSPSLQEMQALAQALHDFFTSTDAASLAKAAKGFAAVSPLPDTMDWQAEEYAFNRLFVGPEAVPAPPYASVYLDADPQLMGKAAADIREMLHALGVAAPQGMPEDFIACELEAWSMLVALLHPQCEANLREHAREALAWLVEEHLGRWVPAFVERARQAGATPAVQAALRGMEYWLCHCTQRSMYAQI